MQGGECQFPSTLKSGVPLIHDFMVYDNTIKCPRCNEMWMQKRGFKRLKHIIKQIYHCNKCHHSFTLNNSKLWKISEITKQRIIELYHAHKPTKNKYDGMGKTTYSTREIARMMGLSPSTIQKIIRKNET